MKNARELRRKASSQSSTPLPKDYLQLARETFLDYFSESFTKIQSHGFTFEIHGEIFNEEILTIVSLVHPQHLAATSFYASCDFDPKVQSTQLERLLHDSLDLLARCMTPLLESPENLYTLLFEPLAALESVPFVWSPLQFNDQTIYIKVDKMNPKLEALTQDWLSSHDPKYSASFF